MENNILKIKENKNKKTNIKYKIYWIIILKIEENKNKTNIKYKILDNNIED